MAFSVLIERRIRGGHDAEVLELLHQLRVGALRQRGYQKGETMVDADDPRHWLVIGTWASADNWKAWLASAERQAVESQLDEHLEGPAKITVYRRLWE